MAAINIEELAGKYQGYLQDEGYGCKVRGKDEQANTYDLQVKYEGMTLLIIFDYDDDAFVRIILPNFYDITSDTLSNALVAINKVAMRCKGAKVHLNSDSTDMMAIAELLETGNSMDAKNLLRYISMVMNAAQLFAKEMRSE